MNITTTDPGLALARLMHLVSPSLPIGSFTYSQGIEWAVECGWIDSAETLGEWIEDQLMTAIVHLDLPVLQRLYAAAASGDAGALEQWSQFLLASRETAELRQEEINRGRALADLLVALDVANAKPWKPVLASCQAAGFATAAVGWGIDSADAASGYAWSWLENLVLAAVKIIPLGQTQGQQLLDRLVVRLPQAVERSLAVEDAMIGASNPALAIASSRHEVQYTRLFRS
ncbi:MAG: urease accessory UreF family protein [Gammaproteobacteria bacterium]|jgi:urease accessory protein